MSDKNAIGIAVELAEGKYKDDKVVQALFNNFKYYKSLALEENKPVDMFWGYRKGLEGQEGYYPTFVSSSANEMFKSVTEKVINYSKAGVAAEALILTLQAMGEDIEY